ncbi:hypothetical protein Tco_0867299, partial [Tanacetum coccineum]
AWREGEELSRAQEVGESSSAVYTPILTKEPIHHSVPFGPV